MSIAKISFLFKFHDENGVEKNVEVPIESTKEIEKKIKMCNNCVEEISTSTQIQSFYSLITRIDSIPEENFEFLLKCIVLGYDIRKLEKYYATMYCHTQVALLKMDSMGIDITPFISGHYSEIGLIKLDLNSIIRMEYQGNHKYVEYVSNYDLSEDVIIDIVQSLYYGLEIVDVNKYVEFHNNPNKYYDYTRVRIYEWLEEVSGEHYPLELNPQSYDNLILKIIQEGRYGICKYFLNKSEHDMLGLDYRTTYDMVMFYINHPEYEDVLLKYLEKYDGNIMVISKISIIISKFIDPEVVANMKSDEEFNHYIKRYCDLHRLL